MVAVTEEKRAGARGVRVMSPEQTEAMLRREAVVMAERIRGRSFHKIEKSHPYEAHRDMDNKPCRCGGLQNADRIFKRAIEREENVEWKRAEAIRLEALRLDELQDGIWGRAMAGDPRSVEVALKVLERRARLHGLDFADMVSGQLVEIEQAKVRVMATALVSALNAAGATKEQRERATAAFFADLRATVGEAPPPQFPRDNLLELPAPDRPALDPEDEDLL
jgi:hypothetical protein